METTECECSYCNHPAHGATPTRHGVAYHCERPECLDAALWSPMKMPEIYLVSLTGTLGPPTEATVANVADFFRRAAGIETVAYWLNREAPWSAHYRVSVTDEKAVAEWLRPLTDSEVFPDDDGLGARLFALFCRQARVHGIAFRGASSGRVMINSPQGDKRGARLFGGWVDDVSRWADQEGGQE